MVLLIDANIILDVLLNRPEFVKESSLVWKLCETEQAKGYISALTFANLVYIMRKQLTPEKIEDVLQRLGLIFEFADLTSADVSKAAAVGCSTPPSTPRNIVTVTGVAIRPIIGGSGNTAKCAVKI
mgnify:CR=1 FL=1